MTNFDIRWEINIEADTPQEAVKEAQRIQSIAIPNIFYVKWWSETQGRWVSQVIDTTGLLNEPVI